MRNRRWRKGAQKADSKWEGELRDTVLKSCDYHPDRIPYTIEHTYQPDFKTGEILIEAKGRFMDSSEAAKYVWVRKALPEGVELIFLFYNPETPMPNAKVRKDGTKRTHREWAVKNNFRWFTKDNIREVLCQKIKDV